MLSLPNAVFLAKFLVPLAFGAVACVIDWRERRIPNWLTVSLLLCGLVVRCVSEGWPGIVDGLYGFLVGFGLLLILYVTGGGGAGDVKFMGAVGIWLGPYHVLFVYVLSAVVLLCFSAWVLVTMPRPSKAGASHTQENSKDGVGDKQSSSFRARTTVPYAIPATIAVLLRFLWLMAIDRTT